MSQRVTLRPLAALLFALAAVGAAAGLSAAADPPAGNAAAGKAIFTVKCVVCHKKDGTGGVKLTGNPTPNWTDPKTWADPKRKDDAYFVNCITNGVQKSGMVAWVKTGQIKAAQVPDLIAYIKTFKPAAKK